MAIRFQDIANFLTPPQKVTPGEPASASFARVQGALENKRSNMANEKFRGEQLQWQKDEATTERETRRKNRIGALIAAHAEAAANGDKAKMSAIEAELQALGVDAPTEYGGESKPTETKPAVTAPLESAPSTQLEDPGTSKFDYKKSPSLEGPGSLRLGPSDATAPVDSPASAVEDDSGIGSKFDYSEYKSGVPSEPRKVSDIPDPYAAKDGIDTNIATKDNELLPEDNLGVTVDEEERKAQGISRDRALGVPQPKDLKPMPGESNEAFFRRIVEMFPKGDLPKSQNAILKYGPEDFEGMPPRQPGESDMAFAERQMQWVKDHPKYGDMRRPYDGKSYGSINAILRYDENGNPTSLPFDIRGADENLYNNLRKTYPVLPGTRDTLDRRSEDNKFLGTPNPADEQLNAKPLSEGAPQLRKPDVAPLQLAPMPSPSAEGSIIGLRYTVDGKTIEVPVYQRQREMQQDVIASSRMLAKALRDANVPGAERDASILEAVASQAEQLMRSGQNPATWIAEARKLLEIYHKDERANAMAGFSGRRLENQEQGQQDTNRFRANSEIRQRVNEGARNFGARPARKYGLEMESAIANTKSPDPMARTAAFEKLVKSLTGATATEGQMGRLLNSEGLKTKAERYFNYLAGEQSLTPKQLGELERYFVDEATRYQEALLDEARSAVNNVYSDTLLQQYAPQDIDSIAAYTAQQYGFELSEIVGSDPRRSRSPERKTRDKKPAGGGGGQGNPPATTTGGPSESRREQLKAM